MSTPSIAAHPTARDPDLRLEARTTGLLYLSLAATGILGYLVLRGALFVPDDAVATLANLQRQPVLAGGAVVAELAIVTSHVLVALSFHRLFRRTQPGLATGIAVLGLGGAMAILASAALTATAVQLAGSPLAATTAEQAAQVQVLHLISENLWGAGGLFFGLWLFPMGLFAVRCGWMPRTLGWVLIAGGVGYLLSTAAAHLAPDVTWLADVLVLPASVGEFWMVGVLLLHGVRRPRAADGAPNQPSAPTTGARERTTAT